MARALAVALAVGVLGSFGAPAPVSAQAADGECCALLVLLPVGARASAMGGSTTALSGPEAAFRNPAGIARLDGTRFVLHHSDDETVNTQVEAFTFLARPFGATVALSYQLFDKGEIPYTKDSPLPIGELAYRDHLFLLTFAVPMPAGFSAGMSYRYFQERIDCTGQCGGEESVGAAHAVDLGARYRPAWEPGLELGIALVNLGSGLRTEGEEGSAALPSRIHIGAAYDLFSRLPDSRGVAFRVAVDVRDRLHDPGSLKGVVGLELDMQQVVFLRAGYTPGRGLGTGAAVGLELRLDRFDVAVSRSFVNSQLDAEPFQVSFGVTF